MLANPYGCGCGEGRLRVFNLRLEEKVCGMRKRVVFMVATGNPPLTKSAEEADI